MSDSTKQSVIQQLTAAIAAVEGADPGNLTISLQNHISTDAIQNLVAHESNAWRLQFETPNHIIEVTGNNTIFVDGQQKREFT